LPHSRQPLSRVLGYRPVPISAGLKRAIWSSALAVLCAIIATAISDSTAVSDLFRYAISLAVRVVRVEPSHRGLGVFLDALNWYARTMLFAFMVNTVLYGLLIFGTKTTISALSKKPSDN
jgi:hypothetical protein